jgi:hypothetical protein
MEDRLWEAENSPALLTLYDKRIASFRAAGKQPKEKDAHGHDLSYYTVQRSNVLVKMAHAEPEPNLQQEKWARAMEDATMSLELDPDCPNALTAMAEILIWGGGDTTAALQEAVDHATRALASKHRANKPALRHTATMHRAEALFRLLKLGFSDELYVKAVTDFEILLKKWKGVSAKVYKEPWKALKEQLAIIRARGAIPKATKPAAARAAAASAAPTPGATAGKGGGEGSSSKRKRAAPEQQLGTQGGSGSRDDVAGAARPTAVGQARGAIPKATKPAAARASATSAAPTPGATAGKGGGEGSSSKRKRAAPEQQLGTQGGSGSQDDVAGAARPTAVGQVRGKTVREWTKEDVSDWLLTIGEAYMQFQESFVAARVEGDALLDIIGGDDEEEAHTELATALRVASKIHRAAIIKAARGLHERC